MAQRTNSTADVLTGDQQRSLLMEFFTDQLKDIYWAEKHLVKALSKMQKKATTDELKQAFADHQTQTEEHVNRLERVFDMIGVKAHAKKCEAMNGIISEGDDIVSETDADTMTRDAALIMAAQKAEHYEIASYGSLITLAKTLGIPDVAEVMAQTLKEEKSTDELLSSIAESHINIEASAEQS